MFRYRLVLFLFIFAFLLVIARLFYWQVVKAAELSELGQSQYGRVIKLEPERGEIKTSDGFALAANKVGYLVYANPQEVKEKEKITQLLSLALQVDIATLSAQLNMDKVWVPLRANIDEKTKKEIEKLKLNGIGFDQQFVRLYPEASIAAQLLGFVGKNDSGEDKGYFGLEGQYDRLLRGKAGTILQIHDALGRPILAKMNSFGPDTDGRTLVTHIDRVIQFSLEKRLQEGIEKYGAAGGMAAVMDPKTGNVLGMASFPSFDPATYGQYTPELYLNPFISSVYEPGSTFKALVMAAALDAKVVKPDTKCTICEGSVSLGGFEIRTWNNKYEKDMSMIDVIRHSDNTGMVFISQKLGLDRMLSYFEKFGIGTLTGIDLQGEVAAAIKEKDAWYPIDVATASFGQGISMTGMSLLSAFSALANEGKRMEPHVVSKIIANDGKTVTVEPKVLSQPVSPATAKVMTEILVNAVDNGEAKWAKPKGYRIAGKTGTAQIPVAGHYDPNKTIASFIGFAPANDPQFAMLVVIDRPTTSIYGSETAAPIFFGIAKDILTYFNVPPSE